MRPRGRARIRIARDVTPLRDAKLVPCGATSAAPRFIDVTDAGLARSFQCVFCARNEDSAR